MSWRGYKLEGHKVLVHTESAIAFYDAGPDTWIPVSGYEHTPDCAGTLRGRWRWAKSPLDVAKGGPDLPVLDTFEPIDPTMLNLMICKKSALSRHRSGQVLLLTDPGLANNRIVLWAKAKAKTRRHIRNPAFGTRRKLSQVPVVAQ